jgi:putative zinc finger protein
VNVIDPHDPNGCPMSDLDGAYVLGALPAAERVRYEAHLPTCPTCREAIQELAGLPGLLARVPVEQVVDPPQPPQTLWPRLVAEAARDRRRSRWHSALTSLAVAACVAVLVIAGWVVVHNPPTSKAPGVPVARMLPFVPVDGESGVTASASLQEVSWGTRIVMTCYSDSPAYAGDKPFTLFVILRDGRTLPATASWKPILNKQLRIEGDIWVQKAQIAALEVRSQEGQPLLRLKL